MAIFENYAIYYNNLYADKNYSAEAAFVLDTFARHDCVPATLLDLGCGTARHVLEMARRGIAATGVDLSPTMLHVGKELLAQTKAHPMPTLVQGNVCTVRLHKKFDAVSSLFHVMSYQTATQDAQALMQSAFVHLPPGALFFFDFWHGEGVLADPPEVRNKIINCNEAQIQRTARPVHRPDAHIVEVHYDVTLRHKQDGHSEDFSETHVMRYWFIPELTSLAHEAGFDVVESGAWMFHKPATAEDWTAWMLLRKQG